MIFQTLRPGISSTLTETNKWLCMYYTSGAQSPEINYIFLGTFDKLFCSLLSVTPALEQLVSRLFYLNYY